MTRLFPARRRAERFDALVEATADGRRRSTAHTAELLELVGALRSVPERRRPGPSSSPTCASG